MRTPVVKEEDENGVVLADSVVENIFFGLLWIAFALILLVMGFVFSHTILHDKLLVIIITLPAVLFFILMVGFSGYMGLRGLLVRESVIVDKRLQSVGIMEESPIKYLKSIKKIPFPDLKTVKITYHTDCEKCSYDSPSMSFWLDNGSWDVSIISIGGDSVWIYQGNSKSKAEKIAGKICEITGNVATHRTMYTQDYEGGG